MSEARPSPLERAFALADTGAYGGGGEIRQKMLKEGFHVDQLDGPVLMRQLRERCRAARARREEA